MFAFLGNIRLGTNALTGPNAVSDKLKAALPKLEPARGKPVLQDMGDDLDEKKMSFFFDETFCDPQTEYSKLEAAYLSRQALAYVGGDGLYRGKSYVIESLDTTTKKTTSEGRAVRIEVEIDMIEVPEAGTLSFLGSLAQGLAPALGNIASALNVRVLK